MGSAIGFVLCLVFGLLAAGAFVEAHQRARIRRRAWGDYSKRGE